MASRRGQKSSHMDIQAHLSKKANLFSLSPGSTSLSARFVVQCPEDTTRAALTLREDCFSRQ